MYRTKILSIRYQNGNYCLALKALGDNCNYQKVIVEIDALNVTLLKVALKAENIESMIDKEILFLPSKSSLLRVNFYIYGAFKLKPPSHSLKISSIDANEISFIESVLGYYHTYGYVRLDDIVTLQLLLGKDLKNSITFFIDTNTHEVYTPINLTINSDINYI